MCISDISGSRAGWHQNYVLVTLIWTQFSVFLDATHKIHKGRYTPLEQKIIYIVYLDGV
jgi:hypothetical protein